MKKIFQKISMIAGTVVATMLIMNACVNYDFDIPDPLDIPVGELKTIAEVRQMFFDNNEQAIAFTEDISIQGVITMDGSSGNIYRNAFIQDETAAINLRLMSPGGLYQGDSIRVNLKGTRLDAFMQMLQIDSVHTGNNVVKLKTRVIVEPLDTDIITLLNDASLQGRLIRLNDVEFHPNAIGTPYADSENLLAQNKTLRDCSGSEIIVRTSGYANFADSLVPGGNGSLVAVLAQYNNDRQLYIRDLAEVNLEGPRCSEQDNEDVITLAEVRQLFNEGTTTIPAGKSIVGVITSDRVNGNTAGRNAYLQDATGAVAIRFTANHDFNLWDRITIFAGTLDLTEFNGLMQINNIPIGNASLSETNIMVEPEETTIQNILNNMDTFESKLVQIPNVTISGGTTFAGDRTLNDGTASISLFTRNEATFADENIPQGTITLTGIVSVFNTPNIIIRNLDDIQQ